MMPFKMFNGIFKRMLAVGLVGLLFVAVFSVSAPEVAHASGGGGGDCSTTNPCIAGSSDLTQSCDTSDGSLCVSVTVTPVDPYNSWAYSGMTFHWVSSSNSPVTQGNVDHYHVYTSVDDNSGSSTTNDQDISGQSWTVDGLTEQQSYSFQVQECDSSNNCSAVSQSVVVDTGVANGGMQSQTVTPQSCSQFYRVQGQWPHARYYMSDCMIQDISSYASVVNGVASLIAFVCADCKLPLGAFSVFIKYNVARLQQVSSDCGGAGAYIDVYGIFWHIKATC
ncbi:MAG: fibronectin type III domain-containing protein [Ktedonobacteraceae bacterium]|nr:fibronectin type III domain-containing protein [Ktedonobacteraceae bacterium]